LRDENRASSDRRFEQDFSRMTEPTITPALVAKGILATAPDHACEPLLGSDDGKWIFESIFAALKNKTVAQAA
jgi:hypothetical protein